MNIPFQQRVHPWMQACFGEAVSKDTTERSHRFIEEALELVQACGTTKDECLQLVEYVYSRAAGEKPQEVGGVMVTLAALCLAHGLDMHECGEVELMRIWKKIEQIRTKQANKPRNSPLPAKTKISEQVKALWLKVREEIHQFGLGDRPISPPTYLTRLEIELRRAYDDATAKIFESH